jgi:hypothetical protein
MVVKEAGGVGGRGFPGVDAVFRKVSADLAEG